MNIKERKEGFLKEYRALIVKHGLYISEDYGNICIHKLEIAFNLNFEKIENDNPEKTIEDHINHLKEDI